MVATKIPWIVTRVSRAAASHNTFSLLAMTFMTPGWAVYSHIKHNNTIHRWCPYQCPFHPPRLCPWKLAAWTLLNIFCDQQGLSGSVLWSIQALTVLWPSFPKVWGSVFCKTLTRCHVLIFCPDILSCYHPLWVAFGYWQQIWLDAPSGQLPLQDHSKVQTLWTLHK